MINICKCKGSMNLHLNCLKMWIQSQLITNPIKGEEGVSYTVKKFNCELCHEQYPITIKNKNNYFNLINYFIPENQNYIILQSLNSIKENEYPLSVHVLMFTDNESSFILGRGHESDIKINDICGLHSRIYMKNGKYYIEDMGSKFGTLVLAKENLVEVEKNILYQIGKTIFFVGKDEKKKKESKIQEIKRLFELEFI